MNHDVDQPYNYACTRLIDEWSKIGLHVAQRVPRPVSRSYVKGWKISPSHYLNQDLSTIWLDK